MGVFWRLAVPFTAILGILALLSFVFAENGVLIFMVRAAVITGALVVAWRLEQSIKERIDNTVFLARRVAKGDFSAAPAPCRDDDLGYMEENLRLMTESLRVQEERVSAEKSLLEGVLGGMAEGVVVLGETGEVLIVNRAASAILGLKENVVRRPFVEVMRVPAILRLVDMAGTAKNAVKGEVEIASPERRSLSISCVPITEPGAGEGRIVMVCRDVTAEKKVQRMKEDFIANVSHELKTPVSALRGYAETLLDGAMEDPATARRFLFIILSQSDRLGRLVNDLLTLSRIEMGEQIVEKRAVRLGDVVNGVATVLEGHAAERSVTIKADIPDATTVMADRDSLSQILLNLTDNAVKFGKEGGVVEIRAKESGDKIMISVSDDGPGIPPEHLLRLGERFYRVDASRSRELGGTGLGLAIVKHLVMAHGSELKVESQVRQGTRFYFTLDVP